MRQFLTESLILAGAGAIAGIGVAYGALRLAGALMPEAGIVLRSQTFGLTRVGISLIDLDVTTLLFTLGITVLTAVLFGLVPAWRRVALRHCHDDEDRRIGIDRAEARAGSASATC